MDLLPFVIKNHKEKGCESALNETMPTIDVLELFASIFNPRS